MGGLRADQIVHPDLEGRWEGRAAPSSEWRFHRDIYRQRPEAQAVVHAHSPFAVSLACLRRGIPAFHYMVAVAGGTSVAPATPPSAPRRSPTTCQLRWEDRRACHMANHELVAFGETLDQVLAVALEVEGLCHQYWRAGLMGEPVLLSDAEMDEVLERFKTYGKRR